MLPSVVHRVSRVVVSAIVTVALVASCSSTTFPQGHAPAHPLAKARTLSSAPEAVRSFPDPATRGEYQLGQGEHLPRSAMRCIRQTGDRPASLTVAIPTIEGDPIVTFISRRSGQNSLILWTTSSFDRYGPSGWERTTCDASDLRRLGFCRN